MVATINFCDFLWFQPKKKIRVRGGAKDLTILPDGRCRSHGSELSAPWVCSRFWWVFGCEPLSLFLRDFAKHRMSKDSLLADNLVREIEVA